MRENLRFYDAYFEENKIYFSAKNINGLFCYNVVTGQTDLISEFEKEYLWARDLHNQVINYNNYIYFMPYYGRGISRFNIIKREMEYIEQSDEKVSTIASAFLYNDKILLIPMHSLNEFAYYDLKTDTICNINEINDKLKSIVGNEYDNNLFFDLQGACVIEDCLILVLYNQDYYLSIDLKNYAINKYTVESKTKLDNVFFDGQNLWITALSNKIYKYHMRQIK